MDLTYLKLLQQCLKTGMGLSKHGITTIDKDTTRQANGKGLFPRRAGRIRASLSNLACHSNPSLSFQSLTDKICYPQILDFLTDALRHGCNHDKDATLEYEHLHIILVKECAWL